MDRKFYKKFMTTTQPSIYIVLLHWKNYKDTEQCLLSLKDVTYKNRHIIIVDNFSNDGSIEKLQQEFPDNKYIYNEDNLGFSCGCNVGIRWALNDGADFVLLLNNDTIVEPGFLEPAVNAFSEHKSIGAVTGKIMFMQQPNKIWQAGGYISNVRAQGVARGLGEIDIGKYDEICDTGWASGAMSLIAMKTFDQVGLLPEEYFFGQEEWDFSTAILRNNLRILYVPTFKSYHAAGGSYRAQNPILNIYGGYLNKMIYAKKYLPAAFWIPWKAFFWLYLRLYWPYLSKQYATTKREHCILISAAHLAFADHKRLKRVTRSDLEVAAKKLGVDSSWK
jgi:GT2 family glycosyltransferase